MQDIGDLHGIIHVTDQDESLVGRYDLSGGQAQQEQREEAKQGFREHGLGLSYWIGRWTGARRTILSKKARSFGVRETWIRSSAGSSRPSSPRRVRRARPCGPSTSRRPS